MYDIRLIDKSGVFHVHHDGDKESARQRARRMAERQYPKADGYTYTGTGQTSDCITVKRKGKRVADIAVEPLDDEGAGERYRPRGWPVSVGTGEFDT